MNHGNANSNNLGQGITEIDVLNAVSNSGYPLQTIIADKLKLFDVTEEWGFIDKDTKDMRNIDIYAERRLYDDIEHPNTKVRPNLSLIIECKQTSLPYVFFSLKNIDYIPNFPLYSGLFENEQIKIKTDDTRDTWSLSINRIFDLQNHEFLKKAPFYCKVFSKCVRKGKELELSGSETYNSVVMPIIKAMEHFQIVVTPPKTALYFDSYITMGVAVIDGPMVGINVNENGNHLEYTPWVRMLRHEHDEELSWMRKGKHFVIDIVHKDFFTKYINEHLMPFANKYADLALKHSKVLVDGKGFIKGMGKNYWGDLEGRLK